jgi:hypothetical protein
MLNKQRVDGKLRRYGKAKREEPVFNCGLTLSLLSSLQFYLEQRDQFTACRQIDVPQESPAPTIALNNSPGCFGIGSANQPSTFLSWDPSSISYTLSSFCLLRRTMIRVGRREYCLAVLLSSKATVRKGKVECSGTTRYLEREWFKVSI